MSKMTMLIAATTKSCLIGRDGGLPWNIPEDLKRFRKITWGGCLIMGGNTFEAIGKPLEGRHSIVLTKNSHRFAQKACDDLTFSSNFPAASLCAERLGKPIFVIGGAMIYRLFQDTISTLHWTKILDETITGDTCFPVQELANRMKLRKKSQCFPAINKQPAYQFLEYRLN